MKIYLTAGHNHFDPGADAVDREHEADLTIEARNGIAQYIPKEQLFVDPDEWQLHQLFLYLIQIVQPGDRVCDIHFNASDNAKATGVEVIVADNAWPKTIAKAEQLALCISTILRIPNRGVKKESETPHKKLAMMRYRGMCLLIEICFITNTDDWVSYQTHKEILWPEIAKILTATQTA